MIAVVVVTYSAPDDVLDRCLASIRDAGGADRVFLVDTGGRERAMEPGVELIRVENRGYGAAANVGFGAARAAGADAVALLNDDVVVRPGWLEALVAELGDDIGAVQPKLLVAGSDPPVINSLGVVIGRDGAGIDVGDGEPDRPEGDPVDLGIFTGGAVVFSSGFVADTGGFDERWFLYYEDVDLALRGAARGWWYRLVPEAVVEHARGVTTSGDPDRALYLQERNRLWSAFRFAGAGTIVRALWLSIRRLRHRPRAVHAKALAAGLAGAPHRLTERLKNRTVCV